MNRLLPNGKTPPRGGGPSNAQDNRYAGKPPVGVRRVWGKKDKGLDDARPTGQNRRPLPGRDGVPNDRRRQIPVAAYGLAVRRTFRTYRHETSRRPILSR